MKAISTNTPKYCLTVEEAAEKLGIKRNLMYKLLLSVPPRVKSLKVGHRRLVPEKALTDFIEQGMAANG